MGDHIAFSNITVVGSTLCYMPKNKEQTERVMVNERTADEKSRH